MIEVLYWCMILCSFTLFSHQSSFPSFSSSDDIHKGETWKEALCEEVVEVKRLSDRVMTCCF